MSKIEVYRSSDTKIIIFDILLTIFISSEVVHYIAKLHYAICISIGLAIGFILFFLFRTKVGFWIVTLIFSVIWAVTVGGLVYEFTKKDLTWGIVSGIFTFIIGIGCHSLARRFYDNVNEA